MNKFETGKTYILCKTKKPAKILIYFNVFDNNKVDGMYSN